MSTLTIGQKKTLRLAKDEQLTIVMSASSTATIRQKANSEGAADVATTSMVASQTKTFGPFVDGAVFDITCVTGTLTETVATVDIADTTSLSTLVGVQAAQPASGSVALNIRRQGDLYRLDFTLTAARITVTDAAGSGASGSLKLFDFVPAAIIPLASRQDYTAFAEGSALTTAAGDADHVLALGSVAANAGDGALTGTEVDFAPVTGTITNLAGTGVGTKMGGATSLAIDGTTTATDLYLNWSGTAATIDATSTIDVTGTISILVAMLGDD